jgi:hypothetical protein
MSATKPAHRDAFRSLGWTGLDLRPRRRLGQGGVSDDPARQAAMDAGQASRDQFRYLELFVSVLPLMTDELAHLTTMFLSDAAEGCRWWFWP